MAKPWSQVETSSGYKTLSPQDKVRAKRDYWNTVVKTKPQFKSLSGSDKIGAQREFFGGLIEKEPKRTLAQKVLPQAITGYQPKPGERTLTGDIFERPGAAVRSAIRGKGFRTGATRPELVPTFQEQSLNTPIQTTIPLTGNKLGDIASNVERFGRGFARDVGGAAADVLTNPAEILPLIAGQSPTIARGAQKAIAPLAKTKLARTAGKALQTNIEDIPKALRNINLDKVIDKSFSKAVGLKVKGKATFKRKNQQLSSNRNAVKTIVENKESLSFIDDVGQPIKKLPENVKEFSQAIGQTKEGLLKELDGLVQTTKSQGSKVRTNKVIGVLDDFIRDEATQINNPNAIAQAEKIKASLLAKGDLKASTANNLVKQYNTEGANFFQGKLGGADANIINLKGKLATSLKDSLIETVEKSTGAEFKVLRQKLGSLLSIEDQVEKKAIQILNQQGKTGGIGAITDILSSGQIARGIFTGNPGSLITGIAQKTASGVYKRASNPDRAIKNMFKVVDKAYVRPLPKFKPEIISDLPVSQQLRVGGRQPQARLPFETGRLPAPKDVPFQPPGQRTPPVRPVRTPNVQGQGVVAGQAPYTGTTLPAVVRTPRAKLTPEQIKQILQQISKGKILRSQGEAKVFPKSIREIRR